MSQLEFFENQIPDNKKLVIKKNTNSQKLSKKQREFNKLVKQLERQREISELSIDLLDKGLKNFTDHIYPIYAEKKVVLHLLILRMFSAFKSNQKKLNRTEKDLLPEIITLQIDHLFDIGPEYMEDQEIKIIFEELNGVSLDEEMAEDFDEMKDEMKDLFDELGIDIDLSNIHKNNSEEEQAEFLASLHDKLNEKGKTLNEMDFSKKSHSRGRSKNQKNEEKLKAIEAVKSKDIHSLYKQLAKILHPDMEQDETLKAEKQALMQKVIEAYQNKDLHTLLKLELQFIQKENSNIESLSDEKLTIYNVILKEQIEDEKERLNIETENPKYRFVKVYEKRGLALHTDWLEAKKIEQNWIMQMKKDTDEFKSFNAAKRLKAVVVEYEREMEILDKYSESPF